MRRIIPFVLAAITGLGGVAVADEHHHDNHGQRHERAEHHAYNQRYYNHGYGYRGYYGGYRYTRPYYGGRHYYEYYHRPTVIVENFAPRPGYVWIRGQWTWNGYEWIWLSGHFVASAYYYGY
jgi:hypothetical protein